MKTLGEERRHLNALLDGLPSMVALWDLEERNVLASAAYADWFGCAPDDLRGMDLREVVGPEDYALLRPYYDAAARGERRRFDRHVIDREGHLRWIELELVPAIVDGGVCGVLVLATDVTGHRESERVMDEAQALAKLGSWAIDNV
ncbi:MAG: PAS domain-containing protein, partial [Marmoricola sp.]